MSFIILLLLLLLLLLFELNTIPFIIQIFAFICSMAKTLTKNKSPLKQVVRVNQPYQIPWLTECVPSNILRVAITHNKKINTKILKM